MICALFFVPCTIFLWLLLYRFRFRFLFFLLFDLEHSHVVYSLFFFWFFCFFCLKRNCTFYKYKNLCQIILPFFFFIFGYYFGYINIKVYLFVRLFVCLFMLNQHHQFSLRGILWICIYNLLFFLSTFVTFLFYFLNICQIIEKIRRY